MKGSNSGRRRHRGNLRERMEGGTEMHVCDLFSMYCMCINNNYYINCNNYF